MSQFSSPSKKTTIAPQKTMKNVLHYLEQQKKKFEKNLAKKAEKQSRKKNMKKTTKHTQKTYDE